MKSHGYLLGLVLLVLGVLFLLQDLRVWNFWGISWFTALFLLGGLFKLIHAGKCCKK